MNDLYGFRQGVDFARQMILDPPCAGSIELRPIRTPEQIAAEEREVEIGEMSRVIRERIKHYSGQDAADYSAALYDAGYRKQVQS